MSSSLNQRIDLVKSCMRREEFDLIISFDFSTIRYLCDGFCAPLSPEPTIVVLAQTMPAPFVVVHSRLKYKADCALGENRVRNYGSCNDVHCETENWQGALARLLHRLSIRPGLSVGIECSIRADYRDELSRILPHADFSDFSLLLQYCRQIKDRTEIGDARMAAQIANVGMACAMQSLQSGRTERTVVIAAKTAMNRRWDEICPSDSSTNLGAMGDSETLDRHRCRVLSNVRKFLFDASPTNHVPKDTAVLVEISTEFNGYHAVLSRMICIGNVSPLDRQNMAILLEIRSLIIATVRPGRRFNDIYQKASDLMEKRRGIVANEVGFLTGLDLREAGSINATTTTQFQKGMLLVIVVEFSVHLVTRTLMADTCVVTERGCEFLDEFVQ